MVKNSKLGPLLEILEIRGVDRSINFFQKMKDQLQIMDAIEGFFDMTSSSPEMTSSKISIISIDFHNSEKYNPYANYEND